MFKLVTLLEHGRHGPSYSWNLASSHSDDRRKNTLQHIRNQPGNSRQASSPTPAQTDAGNVPILAEGAAPNIGRYVGGVCGRCGMSQSCVGSQYTSRKIISLQVESNNFTSKVPALFLSYGKPSHGYKGLQASTLDSMLAIKNCKNLSKPEQEITENEIIGEIGQ